VSFNMRGSGHERISGCEGPRGTVGILPEGRKFNTGEDGLGGPDFNLRMCFRLWRVIMENIL
jgi:hypothetical protein